jgi:HPt (histidine-containing phosphotransfer) domain-containing protein
MNDYLIKPYKENELFEKIALFSPINKLKSTSEMNSFPTDLLFDLTQLKELSRGDEKFINSMLVAFKSLSNSTINQLNESFEARDIESIHKIAHKVKPSIENLQLSIISEDIRQLERFSFDNNSETELKALIDGVNIVLKRVVDDIELVYLL